MTLMRGNIHIWIFPRFIYVLKLENKRDIIIIAGKGHELYQEIKGEKIPFNEREIIKEIIEELQKEPKKKK